MLKSASAVENEDRHRRWWGAGVESMDVFGEFRKLRRHVRYDLFKRGNGVVAFEGKDHEVTGGSLLKKAPLMNTKGLPRRGELWVLFDLVHHGVPRFFFPGRMGMHMANRGIVFLSTGMKVEPSSSPSFSES